MTLRARTNASAPSIVRSTATSAYSTTSLSSAGDRPVDRSASVTSATSAATSSAIASRTKIGLSRSGRGAADGADAGAGSAGDAACVGSGASVRRVKMATSRAEAEAHAAEHGAGVPGPQPAEQPRPRLRLDAHVVLAAAGQPVRREAMGTEGRHPCQCGRLVLGRAHFLDAAVLDEGDLVAP